MVQDVSETQEGSPSTREPSESRTAAARSDGSGQSDESVPRDLRPILPRVLALAGLVMLTDFWFRRHLDWPMWEKLSGGAVLVAVVSAALQTILGEEGFRQNLRRVILWFVRTEVLVCFAFLVLFGGSLVSSVEVSDSASGETIPVVLHGGSWEPSEKELENPESVVRFLRTVTPFGSSYVLEARGYQRHAFDLFPWVGARIRLSSMLEVAPTILLRVPLGRHSLLPEGRIKLCLAEDDCGTVLGDVETAAGRGSVFFGRVRPIPARLLTIWHEQLRKYESSIGRDELPGAQAAFSRGFLTWAEEPLRSSPRRTIREGMVLEARFSNRDGRVQARRRFTVTGEALQDILLEKVDS